MTRRDHLLKKLKNMKAFYGNNGMDWMQDLTGNIKGLFWRLIIMDFVLYNLKLNIWTIVYKWWAVKIPYLYTVCHGQYVINQVLTTLMTVLLTLVQLGFEFRANDKLNHGLWVSNSAHNGKMKWVLFLASYVKFNVE